MNRTNFLLPMSFNGLTQYSKGGGKQANGLFKLHTTNYIREHTNYGQLQSWVKHAFSDQLSFVLHLFTTSSCITNPWLNI